MQKLDQALVSKRMWETSCDAILIKRDEALKERDLAILERNKAIMKHEETVKELEAAIKQKQRFKDMMDKAYRERLEISRENARLRREIFSVRKNFKK